MLDGHELHTVQLVGTLNGLKLDSTNITFKLNDGSAEPLDCKQWMEKDKNSKLNDMKYSEQHNPLIISSAQH